MENKVEVRLRRWFLATWWPPSESDFTSTSLNPTRLRTAAYMPSRVAHVFVWMCSRVWRLCFVCLLSIRVTDMCPACLPVCLRLYLIIVRLIISACHWSIITIKTFTGEECCASGVKVFSLTIWLELILWSASKNHGYWFRSLSNESSSKWTWLWLGCGGSAWFACSRRQFCLDFSRFCRNWHFWRLLFTSSFSRSVCRPTCFLERWCTSAPTSRQVFVFSLLFFHMLILNKIPVYYWGM